VDVMADIKASVLAKLKNKSKASGMSYQQCLQLFFSGGVPPASFKI
jgi:predicted DNA binding CopG/RHH family protein